MENEIQATKTSDRNSCDSSDSESSNSDNSEDGDGSDSTDSESSSEGYSDSRTTSVRDTLRVTH